MPKKHLPVGSYQYNNPQAGARKLVNCTAEVATPDSGNKIVLRRMPGIASFATAGSKCRGATMFLGSLFVVSGQSLYKITADGTVSTIGTIPGNQRVFMADNGTTLVVVTNPDAYSSDGSTVSKITDSVFVSTFGGASDVDFLDGYFVFTAPDSRTSFVSGLNALTFNALDFTTIDGHTDEVLGLLVDHREIIYFKEETIELWYNAANATGFPMSRSPNGFIEVGCANHQTAAKIGGSVYWLSNDNTVRRLSGAQTEIISTVGISKYITNATAAYGFAYTFEDKHYYVLCLPTVTLEYDILAQEWHHRETYEEDIWNVLTVIEGYDKRLVMSSTSGAVGTFSNSTFTEFGSPQEIAWTYQELEAEGRNMIVDRLEISMGTGVGIATGQGSDPLIDLWVSKDGGKTFDHFEAKKMGEQGEYRDRVVFRRLGASRTFVFRAEMTDPVDLIAFDTNVEVRVGRI